MKFKKVYLTVSCTLIYFSSFCQFEPLIKNILFTDSFNKDYSREKIFIHYDRPYYNINDTLWLKGYIVSAKDCASPDSSKIAYIEIINSSGELIKRKGTYCATGIFYSNIGLNEKDFKQETYLRRAYTNYMRNYGDSLFFESKFKMIDPSNNEWNFSVRNISLSNDRFVLSAGIQPLLKLSAQQQNVSVILRSKNKILFKQNTSTDRNGNISNDTILNKVGFGNMLVAEVYNSDHFNAQLPVQVNEELHTDLQFLPEGGTFIANKLLFIYHYS